jgi:hypothetical protein
MLLISGGISAYPYVFPFADLERRRQITGNYLLFAMLNLMNKITNFMYKSYDIRSESTTGGWIDTIYVNGKFIPNTVN